MKAEIKKQMRALAREGEKIYNLAAGKGRELTEKETQRQAAITAELDDLERRLDAIEENEAGRGPIERGDVPGGYDGGAVHGGFSGGAGRNCEVRSKKWAELRQITGDAGDAGEWSSNAEFLAAVASQRWHPELRKQSELIDQDGGFAVPAEMAGFIFDVSLESEIVRSRARVFGMTSRTLSVPLWDNLDRTGGTLYGGIAVKWAAEGGELDIQTAKLQRLNFETKKMAFLGRVPTELEEDSNVFAQEFQRALTKAAGYHLDRAFLTGTGGAEPEGVLSAPCTVEVAPEGSQPSATVNYDNLVEMFSRSLNPMGSIWVVNTSVLPQLLRLSIATGTGGTHIPVLKEGSGSMTMLTRPVVVTEKTPALGSRGDVMFSDFSMYGIGMRSQVSLVISPHVYFSSDELAFRLRTRLDGKAMIGAPVTPENGPTLSPFVVLGARP